MKKTLIIMAFLFTGFYLTEAINLNLSSGNKLDGANWQDINNITNKINLNNNNLNIDGNLITNSKICVGDSCLGLCNSGQIWDNTTSSCEDSCTIYHLYGSNGFGNNRTDTYGHNLDTCTDRARNLSQICEFEANNGRCICADSSGMYNTGGTNWYMVDCR